MNRIVGTVLAGLLGLAFGSFLNVCLSRWPAGESVVKQRSHCRSCGRTLALWENVPLVSWIALRGRCRTCKAGISWRYPLVELAVGMLWGLIAWTLLRTTWPGPPTIYFFENRYELAGGVGLAVLAWLLLALAILDAEHLWLPDWLTLPGIALGVFITIFRNRLVYEIPGSDIGPPLAPAALRCILAILVAAGLVLLIRWTYWLIRRREGIGLGDAKLMAMLGAWLGLSGALLSFAIGVVLGAVFALILLAVPAGWRESETWLTAKLPLGTFLCIGGIVSALWGQPIINAYMRWAGL